MTPTQAAGLALILFGLTEFFLRRGATAKSLKHTAADHGTTPLIFGSYAVVAGLLFVRHLPGDVLPPVAAWIGAGLAFAGLVVRWWAMIVLGQFYTRTLTTTPAQRVVTRGPYRWVRHPGYLGSLLTWVGAAAASGNLLIMILVTAVLIFAYARRIAAEETMLVEALGADYVAYQKRTRRLVPLLF
jgi:protein-S-isoprenylcysteine O-methyltransferase Ste14